MAGIPQQRLANYCGHKDKLHDIYTQWRSQPDNLVPLFKFRIIVTIHCFRN